MTPPKGFIPWNKIGEYKNCLTCGEQFYATPSDAKIGKAKYCSKSCYFESKKGVPNTKLSELYKGKHKEWLASIRPDLRGENHPNWQGGLTPKHTKIRNSKEFVAWAKAIKERDNYECQICGVTGAFLHSNHIKKFADYLDLRFEITNGVTICRDCDNKWVKQHEEEWESYFNFNLETRGYMWPQ